MVESSYTFFLGGHDLEMEMIAELLCREGVPFFDKGLAWGAEVSASAYREEITGTLQKGRTPVLVELPNDLGLDPDQIVEIDHHGKKAGADRPTSLHQVFSLLGLPPERWTREFDLVAENDRGYIPAMIEIGATKEEIIQVRAADRKAQGITEEEEQAGERAVSEASTLAGGALTLARLPHTKTAVVTDRMESVLGGPGVQNLLILCPSEVDFYGEGEWIHLLDRRFPGGVYGGALPQRGYWFKECHSREGEEILRFLAGRLEAL